MKWNPKLDEGLMLIKETVKELRDRVEMRERELDALTLIKHTASDYLDTGQVAEQKKLENALDAHDRAKELWGF